MKKNILLFILTVVAIGTSIVAINQKQRIVRLEKLIMEAERKSIDMQRLAEEARMETVMQQKIAEHNKLEMEWLRSVHKTSQEK